MNDISSIVLSFVEGSMIQKGLTLYSVGNGKYLAMDPECNTRFKFDISFSDSAFVCLILKQGQNELMLSESFNISWTDGPGIRSFFDYIKSL